MFVSWNKYLEQRQPCPVALVCYLIYGLQSITGQYQLQKKIIAVTSTVISLDIFKWSIKLRSRQLYSFHFCDFHWVSLFYFILQDALTHAGNNVLNGAGSAIQYTVMSCLRQHDRINVHRDCKMKMGITWQYPAEPDNQHHKRSPT